MKRIFLITALGGALSCSAAGPGDEVVIIYNTRVPASKEVAEHYAQRRGVPAEQMFGFELSNSEEMSRTEFRESLQRPLAKALSEQKLWRMAARSVPATTNHAADIEWKPVQSRIRYAVLCSGVPSRITAEPDLKEPGTEKLRPEMRRNEAAVDSELVLLPMIEQHLVLAGPLRNPVYTSTNVALLHPTNGVLLVARLDGPSPEIARGLVDKALAAEADGLWGRAYFDVRNTTDPGFKLGDDWIRGASELCRRLGFETVVDDKPGTFPAGFPMSQIAIYAGWYEGDVSGPFTRPAVEFMPGAFAYHLHSFSAHSLRATNRFWVGPLLAKGATITMGCVDEPYLTGTPDVAVFLARLIYNGFSFGEAACVSQPVLSWQTTVVGDPLYRPFGKNGDAVHLDLQRRQSKWLEWSWLRLLNINLANGKPLADCISLLEKLEATKRSAVLSEKLGDLCSAQGKPSSAIYSWSQALNLEPSPQQRLRLRLTLGDKLTELGREAEAYEDLQKVLQDCPDYPDQTAVYRKLLPLARKLGKKSDADLYEAQLNRPGVAR